jgi:hypothetical protein
MSKFWAWFKSLTDLFGITLPNSDQMQSWVRTSLGSLGAIIIQHGWTNQQNWTMITGVVLFISPYVWGAIVHTVNAKIKAVEALDEVKTIEIKPNATGVLAEAVADQNRPKVVDSPLGNKGELK